MLASFRWPEGETKIRARSARSMRQRPIGLMAQRAALGLAIDLHLQLRRIRGVDDHALLADDADLLDGALSHHILDRLMHVLGLVLEHRETRAANQHIGQLRDVPHRFAEDLLALVAHDENGEYDQRNEQRQDRIHADLEAQARRQHRRTDQHRHAMPGEAGNRPPWHGNHACPAPLRAGTRAIVRRRRRRQTDAGQSCRAGPPQKPQLLRDRKTPPLPRTVCVTAPCPRTAVCQPAAIASARTHGWIICAKYTAAWTVRAKRRLRRGFGTALRPGQATPDARVAFRRIGRGGPAYCRAAGVSSMA